MVYGINYPMPYLDINSKKIFYTSTGTGPPLLLLHDGFYDSSTWDSVRELLAADFCVIDYDRFGYGRSDRYAEMERGDILAHSAAELAGFIGALGLDRVHLCGHCLGGAAALLYSLEHPERVNRLVLEAAGFYSDHKLLLKCDATFRPFDEIDPRLREDLVRMNGEEGARFFWEIVSANRATYIMNEHYNLLPELKKINIPVFLINGDRDFYFDPEHPVSAYKKFKNARLWIVPETGHSPHKERPEEFVRKVGEFLTAHLE